MGLSLGAALSDTGKRFGSALFVMTGACSVARGDGDVCAAFRACLRAVLASSRESFDGCGFHWTLPLSLWNPFAPWD